VCRYPARKSTPPRRRTNTFRIVTGKDDVLKVMQFLGDTLDYSTSRNTVAHTPDQQAKHEAYATVWHTMIDALGGYGQPPHKSGRNKL